MEGAIKIRQGRQQLKEEPPDSQGKKSNNMITSGGRPVEKVIQSRQGRQRPKEESHDSQGKESIQEFISGGRPVESHPEQAGQAATEGRAT